MPLPARGIEAGAALGRNRGDRLITAARPQRKTIAISAAIHYLRSVPTSVVPDTIFSRHPAGTLAALAQVRRPHETPAAQMRAAVAELIAKRRADDEAELQLTRRRST